MDIEKNDVDLSKLFVWKKEVPIYNSDGELATTVYMRVVGDAEVNKARVFALRESAKLRKALKTPGTDENIAFVSGLEVQDKPTMVKAIVLLRMRELVEDSRNEVEIKFPKEIDSSASLEEQEKYQQEIDDFPVKFNVEVEKIVRKKLQKEEKSLQEIPEEEIKKNYIDQLVDYLCNNTLNERFVDMCVYLGTYRNKRMTKKSFESFEEYDNSARELKEILKESYQSIEVSVPDLKKSLEVMP